MTPSSDYSARSVVWHMPPHETSKALSDFMMAVPHLEVSLVEPVSRGGDGDGDGDGDGSWSQ